MGDHGKSGKNRRLKFFKNDPIANDVLDIVGHHAQRGASKKGAKTFMMKSRKGFWLSAVVDLRRHVGLGHVRQYPETINFLKVLISFYNGFKVFQKDKSFPSRKVN